MKKFIILFSVVFIFLITQNLKAQWQLCYGTANLQVYSIAASGNNIFVGVEHNGVYRSTNNGISFTQTALNNRNVGAVAVNGNYIFAGTDFDSSFTAYIYLSTNNGINWSQSFSNESSFSSFTVCGGYVFAGTFENGIYKSANNGTSWTKTCNEWCSELVSSGNNIIEGYSGIFLSANYGGSWTCISNDDSIFWGDKYVMSIAASDNRIFTGLELSYVYLTTNNGTNWRPTGLSGCIYALAISGNNIFAGEGEGLGGVKVSTNNGTNWVDRSEGGLQCVNCLCIANNYIFAGTDLHGVYRRPLTELIGIKQISEIVPSSYSLMQNYPNPFNPSTSIRYEIPKTGLVKIVIFDENGREVESLVNEKQTAGTYEATWDASKYPSGVYFYRLTTESYSETKKMILLK